jgi:hypothetical protein
MSRVFSDPKSYFVIIMTSTAAALPVVLLKSVFYFASPSGVQALREIWQNSSQQSLQTTSSVDMKSFGVNNEVVLSIGHTSEDESDQTPLLRNRKAKAEVSLVIAH